MAGEKFIALEETSQEIKTAVEGVKTDVAGVKTDVDTVGTDLTTVKNNIGTPAGGKTVVTMFDEIKNSSSGDEFTFVKSNNVLLSKSVNYEAGSSEGIVKLNGKYLLLYIYASGCLTMKITANCNTYYTPHITAISLTDGRIIYDMGFSRGSSTKMSDILVYKGDIIVFKVNEKLTLNTIDLLGDIQKIVKTNELFYGTSDAEPIIPTSTASG